MNGFKKTQPRLCSYWPEEKNLYSQIAYRQDGDLMFARARSKFEALEQGLSSNASGAFVPICSGCPIPRHCRMTRINTGQFDMSPSQEAKLKAFLKSMRFDVAPVRFYVDHFELFKKYVGARHGNTDTDLAKIQMETFRQMYIENSAWQVTAHDRSTGALVSVAYVDQYKQDMSLEYIAYDRGNARKSPGTATILFLANAMKANQDGCLYLGAWSSGSPKLDYKKNFHGLEIHSEKGWISFDHDRHPENPPVPGFTRLLTPG